MIGRLIGRLLVAAVAAGLILGGGLALGVVLVLGGICA